MFSYSLGMGLAFSWLWLFYLQGPLLHSVCTLDSSSPEQLFRWYMLSMCFTCFALAFLIKIPSLRDKKTTMISCSIILALCPLLTAGMPYIAAEGLVMGLSSLLAVIGGIASAFFYTAWMETISIKNLKQSSAMFGLATTFAAVVTVISTITPHWMWILLVLSPPVSVLLMQRQTPDESSLLHEYQQSDSVALLPVKLILLLVFIYCNGGIMIALAGVEQSYAQLFYLAYLAYILFSLIAGGTLYYFDNIDLRLLYQVLLPLMSIGFLLFCFYKNTLAFYAFLLLQGGSALLNMYIWLLFPYISRFSTRSAAVCASGLFFSLFSVLSGNIITDILSNVLVFSRDATHLAFIAGIISVLTIFLFPDKKGTFSGWQSTFQWKTESPTVDKAQAPSRLQLAPEIRGKLPSEIVTASSQGSNSETLFDALSLSLREKEILVLLLKGRSGRFISESLNISHNTVKFHIRNIYNKLGVNSRQELISFLENEKGIKVGQS